MDASQPNAETTARNLWLDAVRGLAVLLVVVYHYAEDPVFSALFDQFSRSLAVLGMFGVDLFYVLSGYFILGNVLRMREWDAGRFLQARATRIYPAYIVCLGLLMAFDWLSGRHSATVTVLGGFLHVLMLHSLIPGVASLFNGVFWTLGVEFSFYFLMAMLGGWFRQPGSVAGRLALLWGCALLFRYAVFVFLPQESLGGLGRFFASTQLPGVLDAFAVGGAAYLLARRGPGGSGVLSRLLWPASLLLILLVMYHVYRHMGEYWDRKSMVVYWRDGLALSFAVLVLAAARMRAGWIRHTGLPALGRMGFSCYLWHFPVIALLGGLAGPAGLVNSFLISLCIMLALSYLSWRYIEQRFHASSVR